MGLGVDSNFILKWFVLVGLLKMLNGCEEGKANIDFGAGGQILIYLICD